MIPVLGFVFFFKVAFEVLGIELRNLRMLGKCSTTEIYILYIYYINILGAENTT